MAHLTDAEIINFERLPAEQKRVILAHTETCPLCFAVMEKQRGVWAVMGAWEIPAAPEQGGLIQRRIVETEAGGHLVVRRWLRVAAVVVVAAGVGYVGGMASRPQRARAATAEEAAAALHLRDVDGAVSGDLEEMFAAEPENAATEERP